MLITNSVAISGPAERVWDLTIDVEGWPALTPTMTSVGRLEPDQPFGVGGQARVKQPRQRERIWTVTQVERGQLFEWVAPLGRLIMTGRHRITPEAAGCRNVLELELTGFGSAVLGRFIRRHLETALRIENEGFKRAAESSSQRPAAEHRLENQ